MPNLIINNFCNQKCTYCFAEKSMTTEKLYENNQSLKVYLQILSFLKKNEYPEVRYLGWEPLLHPRIREFLQIAQKGWFQRTLFSNINFPCTYIHKIFDTPDIFPEHMNCNTNNRDFYSDMEYAQVLANMIFFRDAGVDMTIWYNIYDLSKPFADILQVADATGIRKINLKITNTAIGSLLIIDTGSRVYGKYIFDIISKYSSKYEFYFSCGLSRSIFSEEEISYMRQQKINLPFGCEGFSGKFDIDIDGSIYKCFPTRSLYFKKGLSIKNFSQTTDIHMIWWIKKSDGICAAHTLL